MKPFSKRTRQVFGLTVIAVLMGGALWFWPGNGAEKPVLFVELKPDLEAGYGYRMSLTNTSRRGVVCWISEPQFQIGDTWGPPVFFFRGGGIVPQIGAGCSLHVNVASPRAITAPLEDVGANKWRVAVRWGYTSPTTWREWMDQLSAKFLNRPPNPSWVIFTNYSTTVKMSLPLPPD